MTEPNSSTPAPRDEASKTPSFWQGWSTEPVRPGDKTKAVLFGIGLALLLIALSWFFLRQNATPV